MAQRGKALADKPDGLSLIPWLMCNERIICYKLSSDCHMYVVTGMDTCTQINIIKNFFKKFNYILAGYLTLQDIEHPQQCSVCPILFYNNKCHLDDHFI